MLLCHLVGAYERFGGTYFLAASSELEISTSKRAGTHLQYGTITYKTTIQIVTALKTSFLYLVTFILLQDGLFSNFISS
jgi:hypothetical protein